MKIQKIILKKFKRFSHLTIDEIPETAKLIVLVGPNGAGKTSLFEGFNHYYKTKGFKNHGQQDYIEKKEDEVNVLTPNPNWHMGKVQMWFYSTADIANNANAIRGKFYFRTAYRNESDFSTQTLTKQADPTHAIKLQTLMQNDITVSENYQRLISQTLSGVYSKTYDTNTVAELREELIGKVQKSLANVFDDLNLSSIGDPLTNGSFYFEKGTSKNFHYKNLSAGEKSVFDLVLDMIIKSVYYPDAVFCIDEPEAHMHTSLQSRVLLELYKLTPENSQLWISTHSIGMLKQAEDIEKSQPGSVVFLDFDNRDFDSDEIMVPAKIDRTIWNRFFSLAFADFSELIAPKRIVFCEGNPNGRKYKDFDAQIYGKIFGEKYHDTMFVSVGSSSELENIENQSVKIVSNILKSTEILKFVDRDDKSEAEIQEAKENGINVSSERHIESYLLDDEIITKLCNSLEKADKIQECLDAKQAAIAQSVGRGNPADDLKSPRGKIFTELKKILELTACGNNPSAFLRDTITPLINEDTSIYQKLESEIFG